MSAASMNFPVSRRALLQHSAVGFGSLALASMLAGELSVRAADENPLAARLRHVAVPQREQTRVRRGRRP